MKKRLVMFVLACTLALPASEIVYAAEPTTEAMDYDTLKSEYDSLKSAHATLQSAYASLLVNSSSYSSEEYDLLQAEYDSLKSDYDELLIAYEEAIAKIEELSNSDENLPSYDISGTVKEVTNSTFTVTTAKGNTYTFYLGNEQLNVGETISFHFKGEIASSESIQTGTISGLTVTAAAPAGAEYNTGITFDNLSRNPDEYEGKLVKFSGTVVQLIEDPSMDEIQIRFAINDDYEKIIYCGYDKGIVNSRVLEGDWITIYGTSVGLISYESTIGGTITIPAVYIDQIDQ